MSSCLQAKSWQHRRKELIKQKELEFSHEDQQLESVILAEGPIELDFGSKKDFLVPDNYILLDRPAVMVYGPERDHVICESELNRPSIDGLPSTWQNLVDNELVLQEAMRYKIPIDLSVADKYILSIRKQHGLSMDDVNAIFRNAHLSPEQGRQELVKMYTKNSVIEHKILSRLYIPQQDVEAYYHAHPIIKPTKYELQLGLVPFNGKDPLEQKKDIIAHIKKEGVAHIQWSESFWLKEDEIAEDKQFILSLKPGRISAPMQTPRGFELMKLCSKKEARPVSLEKRYREIVTHLREEKAQVMIEDYLKDLRKGASLAFCV